jgi:hypothetical protein
MVAEYRSFITFDPLATKSTKFMEVEIQNIIKKNLPAQVGETLKKRLEQADIDASELKNYKEAVIGRDKTITELTKKIEEYKQFDVRNANIDAREVAVKEEERNMKVKNLEYQLQAEKEKTVLIREVTMGLVRNTEYKKTIFDNESQVGYTDSRGNWVQPGNINKSLDETTKAE